MAHSCSAARILTVGACLNKSALRNSNARYVPVKSKDMSAMNVQYSLKLIGKSGGSTHRKQVSLN